MTVTASTVTGKCEQLTKNDRISRAQSDADKQFVTERKQDVHVITRDVHTDHMYRLYRTKIEEGMSCVVRDCAKETYGVASGELLTKGTSRRTLIGFDDRTIVHTHCRTSTNTMEVGLPSDDPVDPDGLTSEGTVGVCGLTSEDTEDP